MLIFFILSPVLSSKKYTVTVNSQYAEHTSISFGFEKGGTYSIDIFDTSARLTFNLLNADQLQESHRNALINGVMNCNNYQNFSDINGIADVNQPLHIEGVIPSKDIYTPTYVSCSTQYNFKLSIEYKNIDSYLDYRNKPFLIILPVFLGFFGLLFILWLVNWFVFFTLDVKIHYFLTACYSTIVIFMGIYYGYYLNLKNKGTVSDAIYYSYYVFDCLHTAIFLFTLLLASTGWYITTKKIEWKFTIIPGIAIVVFVTLSTVLTIVYISSLIVEFIIAIATIVCLCIFVYFVVKNVGNISFHIAAHMLVIQERGINPKTTPVYRKYKMFKVFLASLYVYLGFYIIDIVVQLFGYKIVWLPTLVNCLMYAIIYVLLFFVFMLRKNQNNGYRIFDDGDVEELSQSDVQQLNLDSFENGQEWDGQTPLPPQPFIINGYESTPFSRSSDRNNTQKTNEDTINANDNVNPSSGSNYIPTSPKDPHTNV